MDSFELFSVDMPADSDEEVVPVDETPEETPEEIAPVEETPQPLNFTFDGEVFNIAPDRPAYVPAGNYLGIVDSLAEARNTLSEMNARKAEMEFQMEELRREFGRRLAEMQEAARPLENEIFEQKRIVRQREREVEFAQRQLRDALLSEKVQREFQKNSFEFDKRTAGLFWREWALEHQLTGAKMIATAKRAILGDKMGLGKTLTSMIAADMMQSQKILVIVPDDVVSNFVREIHHWTPHRHVFMVGKMPRAQRDIILGVMKQSAAFTVVLNYSVWRKDKGILEKLKGLRFDTVIMDEAHSIKNIRTAAFKGCKEIVLAENSCPNCRGAIQPFRGEHNVTERVCVGEVEVTGSPVSADAIKGKGCGWSTVIDRMAGNKREYGALRSVRNVIPMTGTVILNKPNDLFALLHLIDDKQFDTESNFLYTYCMKDPYTDKWTFRPGGLESLTKKLAGRYIARDRKSAGVVLPKQEIVVHNIELDETQYAAQHKVITQLSKHAMIILSNGERLPIFATIALITRKRQANVWPAGIEIKDPETGMIVFSVGDEVQESIKLDRIIMEPARSDSGDYEGLVPEYTAMGDKINGERVVIFSQFKGPLKALEERIKAAGISVVRLDGDTPEHVRDEVRKDFDRKYADVEGYEYKWQVCLANYKSGGVGLNLNAATHSIIVDEEWNAGKRDQAYARTDRMGQTEETSVDVLRISRTIDTWLADLIESKESMVQGFENNAAMANSMLDAMRKGDML